jgi:hypothetical protein
LRFGVSDLETEDFPAAVSGDANGDNDRLRQPHPPADPGFAAGGIQEHIRVC